MSVGGEEIVPNSPGAAQMQPFMRTHNLRYSSAVNDFSISPIDDVESKPPVDQPSHKFELSTEVQNR